MENQDSQDNLPSERKAQGEEDHDESQDALWSISAVSRSTGITAHTLRAWERRFGTPVPVRLSSHHRRYTQEQVEQLQLVAKALSRGHRAGDIVPLAPCQLKELLAITDGVAEEMSPLPGWLEDIFLHIRAFSRDAVVQRLKCYASRMGIRPFLENRVIPLLSQVGEAWQAGQLQIRHEHFVTDILQDILRQLRAPLEITHEDKPAILLCALPNEHHGLGLQIVALLISLHQLPIHMLGIQTPINEIIEAARSLKPYAVGISITAHTANETTEGFVREISNQLPAQVELWLGGNGAQDLRQTPAGCKILQTIEQLEHELIKIAL